MLQPHLETPSRVDRGVPPNPATLGHTVYQSVHKWDATENLARMREEDNDLIMQVGSSTPMGNLLRRYWTPACLTRDIPEPDCTPLRVRLLGEDLVAFRDTEGRIGLIDENCPHRGTSLFFGRNEDGGLRCVYHGWQFDVSGSCVDMPSEPVGSVFKDKLKVLSYPVHESGGVIWTYMGPKTRCEASETSGRRTYRARNGAPRPSFSP